MAETANREIAYTSKLVPGQHLGNPKVLTTLPETTRELLLGTVLGKVEKIVTRTMPTGDAFEGFSGMFEGIPADPKLPIVRSGVCYFPAGFHELIAEPLKKAKEQNENASIQFAMEVSAIRSKNPQGYSWQYKPILAEAQADPLADVRAAIGSASKPAIEDKSASKKK